jgi:hypothetical protein
MDFLDDLLDGRPSKPRWLQLAAELEARPVDKRQDERPPPVPEPAPRMHAPLKLAPAKRRSNGKKPR